MFVNIVRNKLIIQISITVIDVNKRVTNPTIKIYIRASIVFQIYIKAKIINANAVNKKFTDAVSNLFIAADMIILMSVER